MTTRAAPWETNQDHPTSARKPWHLLWHRGRGAQSQYEAKTSADLAFTYSFDANTKITFGGSNIFNVTPTPQDPNETDNGFKYDSVQFGLNGAAYFDAVLEALLNPDHAIRHPQLRIIQTRPRWLWHGVDYVHDFQQQGVPPVTPGCNAWDGTTSKRAFGPTWRAACSHRGQRGRCHRPTPSCPRPASSETPVVPAR